jgi:O-acetylhomoserine (thiol)-lyase
VARRRGQRLHLAIVTLMGGLAHRRVALALRRVAQPARFLTLPRFGIETTFVDPRDLDAWRAALRPNTRLLFGETLGNPGLEVLDIPRVAELAHEHGLPLLVDSTFTTPYLMRPFEHGADLVYHSATKFLSGHDVVIGGLLVNGGRFDWGESGRAPEISHADRSLRRAHDMVFADESTTAAFLRGGAARGVRDFGACMAPMTAFKILQGIARCRCIQRHVISRAGSLRPCGARWSSPLAIEGANIDRALARRCFARAAAARIQLLDPGARDGAKFIESLRFSRICQRRRCQVAGHSPGFDDALPRVGRGSLCRRHHRRHDPALRRARGRR